MKKRYHALVLGVIVAIPLTIQLVSSFDTTDPRSIPIITLVVISFLLLVSLAHKGCNN